MVEAARNFPVIMQNKTDQSWMSIAIELAKQAGESGEVPVGAVLILDDKVIGKGRNQSIELNDPSAHAEIQALREAGSKIGNYRLNRSKIYVTIEPCTMCIGALVHARIEKLIFGAREKKSGAVSYLNDIREKNSFNHRFKVIEGVLEDECSQLMRNFFRARRKNRC
jgi:tRNA(adenine34) deaminase